jgi:hypothetical protein
MDIQLKSHQRDYAHEENHKGSNVIYFYKPLFDYLEENILQRFDFVYGSTEIEEEM